MFNKNLYSFKKIINKNGLCNNHRNNCNYYTKSFSDKINNLIEIIDRIEENKIFYSLKNLNNYIYLEKNYKIKMDKAIILFKSPIKLFSSYKKNKNKNLNEFIHKFNDIYMEEYKSDFNYCSKNKIPYLVVEYDKLITSIKEKILTICNFLEIDFEEYMLNPYLSQNVHLIGGNNNSLHSINNIELDNSYKENLSLDEIDKIKNMDCYKYYLDLKEKSI